MLVKIQTIQLYREPCTHHDELENHVVVIGSLQSVVLWKNVQDFNTYTYKDTRRSLL